jgi:hypothetical protein
VKEEGVTTADFLELAGKSFYDQDTFLLSYASSYLYQFAYFKPPKYFPFLKVLHEPYFFSNFALYISIFDESANGQIKTVIADSQAALAGVQVGAWVAQVGPVDTHTPLTTVETLEQIEAALRIINSLGVDKLALITKRVRRW